MKVTKIISSQIGAVKGRVQTKNSHSPVSFKKRTDATADDSNISWGGILFAVVAVFAAVTLAMKGINKFMGKYVHNAKEFLEPKNLMSSELKLDKTKLSALPLETKRAVKEAINLAITHDEYQKVLRDFCVGM